MNKPDDGGKSVRRRAGRPLSFDRDEALEQAMLLFWRHGYETTSINDLTRAMRITAPSLYTAFGDKRRLFLEAAQRYAGDPEASAAAIDNAPTACEAARSILQSAVVTFTGETTPRGCLLASATASGSSSAADVQDVVAGYRQHLRERVRARIERDIADKILPTETDAAALAGMVMAVLQGLSVLARDGASRASLSDIVDTALNAWPTARQS
ncbi:TetR/AcrR family transcriptional regulator [Salinisphaera sp. Q1T1-3]|uniref:TetR/AcrR family transcriptional regulator n=1 Tax=Salinisphaera sp. Q1T1-3 TaxID=2321229 RepID=UPI000E75AE16|nr:TetR/AcrR family transcriptional regulator [Salinisphaera sp. Q1T1-3]RJS94881.1 TetR/AcrR family transcriptional regulator [Salinisphaera sp. Q1T1-3]